MEITTMEYFVPLFDLALFSALLKAVQKGWRLFAVLCVAALVTGCVSTPNKFDRSPCACDFKNINTGNYGSQANA